MRIPGSDKDGLTVLHQVVIDGTDMQVPPDRGVDIDSVDRVGRTALYIAVLKEDENAARFLIEKGANVNICDAEGMPPVYFASASPSSAGVLQLLLENNADVNVKGRHGSALHVAASNRNVTAVRMLMNYHADPNVRDSFGNTPVDCAVSDDNDAHAMDIASWDMRGVFFAAKTAYDRNRNADILAPIRQQAEADRLATVFLLEQA